MKLLSNIVFVTLLSSVSFPKSNSETTNVGTLIYEPRQMQGWTFIDLKVNVPLEIFDPHATKETWPCETTRGWCLFYYTHILKVTKTEL
mgnify:CR=1 FL=1